jgi:hypothetical protein
MHTLSEDRHTLPCDGRCRRATERAGARKSVRPRGLVSRLGPRAALAAAGPLATALLAATSASAASAPAIATGRAQSVSYASATLTGTVNPHGEDTTYFFQYGPTRAYGSQTALADAGSGTTTVHVHLAVAGLQPLTKYHFRLLAVNASGASTGGDASFTTKKVPLSLAILVAPNPVAFGGTVFVDGALSGTGSAGAEVALQANPFPYLQGFANVGNPEVTTANGSFSFPVLNMGTVTQFRVVTVGPHPVVSPVAVESVAVRVTSHVGHTRRPHLARIYGTVTPAEDGAQVAILRIAHGRGVLVAGTNLRHHDATSSTFSRVVRVRPGAYRVLVRVTSGAQVSSYGRTLIVG